MVFFCFYIIVGGQKQANRVSKQISKCTSKIAKLLDKYKSLTSDLNDQQVQNFSVSDVCDLQSSFWISPDHSDYTLPQVSDIPAEA